MSLPWPLNVYVVSRKHNLVFSSIPKVGTQKFKEWFHRLEGLDDVLKYDALKKKFNLSHQVDVNAYDFFEQAYKFAFVRNPYNRLVSAYLYKLVHTRDLNERVSCYQTFCDFTGIPPEVGPTFQEFVRSVFETRPEEMDAHWKPQHLFLEIPRELFRHEVTWDAIMHIEALPGAMDTLVGKTGVAWTKDRLNCLLRVAWETRLCSEVRPADLQGFFKCAGGYPAYRYFWTPELKRMVAEKYAEDFERFGYAK